MGLHRIRKLLFMFKIGIQIHRFVNKLYIPGLVRTVNHNKM